MIHLMRRYGEQLFNRSTPLVAKANSFPSATFREIRSRNTRGALVEVVLPTFTI